MGFYLLDHLPEPAARRPPAIPCPMAATKSIYAPFTHTRLSSKYWDADTKLAYYGYRYLSPGMGRWLSHDPIGTRGGRNLYGYTRNNPSTYWEYLGLVAVTHDHPDPAKVASKMEGNKFFSSRDFWQPWETPDPMSIGGWTGYQDKKVKCGCDCVTNQLGKITGWTMSCTVSWKAQIVLNSGWKKGVPWEEPLSQTGALGHEQRHVKGAIKLVHKKVVEPLGAKDGSFVTEARCTAVADTWARFFTGVLNLTLDPRADHHKDKHPGEDAYSDQPNDGELYEPLPNSTSIPGDRP